MRKNKTNKEVETEGRHSVIILGNLKLRMDEDDISIHLKGVTAKTFYR